MECLLQIATKVRQAVWSVLALSCACPLCKPPARCSSWLSEFRYGVLKVVGRRFELSLCFTQEKSAVKKVLGPFIAKEETL